MRARFSSIVLCVLLLQAACQPESNGGGDGDPRAAGDEAAAGDNADRGDRAGGDPSSTGLVGVISLLERRMFQADFVTETNRHAHAWARFVDSPFVFDPCVPFCEATDVVMTEGECLVTHVTGPAETCIPACTAPEMCVDGACVQLEAVVCAGAIALTGLNVDIGFDCVAQGYALSGQLPTDDDLYTDDATILADVAGGGGFPPLSMSTRGVTNDDGCFSASLAGILGSATDFTVTWTPETPQDPDVRIVFELRATTPHQVRDELIVRCVSEDDGEIVIPHAMIQYYNDNPLMWNSVLCRRSVTVDEQVSRGIVRMVVTSEQYEYEH